MRLSPLLSSRPPAMRILVASVVPCAFGALTGLMLGLNEVAYLVLVGPIGILGGFRLVPPPADALSGLERQADLLDPAILLVVATTFFGSVAGVLRRADPRAPGPPPRRVAREPGPRTDRRRTHGRVY